MANIYFDIEVTREVTVPGHPGSQTVTTELIGTLTFMLHDDIVPKTAKNFRELATGQHGYGYAGSRIFRIISDNVIQGGDVTSNDGHGGRSIFPRNRFEDENFIIKHTKAGQVTMANTGPNSNTSQFFITLGPCPWLDGTHVAFGEVTGIKSTQILDKMADMGSTRGFLKVQELRIVRSGVLESM